MQGYGRRPASTWSTRSRSRLYVAGWVAFCGTSPGLGGLGSIASWWLRPGRLPEGDRLEPALRGPRPRLRKRTAHRALLPAARRAALLPASRHDEAPARARPAPARGPHAGAGSTSRCTRGFWSRVCGPCWRPAPAFTDFVPIVVLLAVLGVADRTIFLAARGEHYGLTVVCFAFAGNWIAAAKAVQLALWFWAGFSKLEPPLPYGRLRDDEQRPVHALSLAAAPHVPPLPGRSASVRPRDRHGARGHRARGGRAHRLPGDAPRRTARRRDRADARAARVHHEQRADGRAHRVERRGGLRRLRALLGASRRLDPERGLAARRGPARRDAGRPSPRSETCSPASSRSSSPCATTPATGRTRSGSSRATPTASSTSSRRARPGSTTSWTASTTERRRSVWWGRSWASA